MLAPDHTCWAPLAIADTELMLRLLWFSAGIIAPGTGELSAHAARYLSAITLNCTNLRTALPPVEFVLQCKNLCKHRCSGNFLPSLHPACLAAAISTGVSVKLLSRNENELLSHELVQHSCQIEIKWRNLRIFTRAYTGP